ncbi:MAG: ISNCY family transposase, partial [Anaerolineales bacterium]
MELVTMSKAEMNRLEVMGQLEEKRMTQRAAAEILGMSIRQVRRLLRAYRREGAAGLVSKQRGKPSHHQLDRETVQAAIDLLHGRYAGFGPTLAHEKMVEGEGLKLGLGSVRKIMIEEGLWKAKKARKVEVHQMRERRASQGELEQMDGTDHDWFEGRGERCTLLVMIDDATGQLGALSFVPEESFFGYCGLLRQYLAAHGRPAGLYTDRHGIFRVNIPNTSSGDNLTQFGRAMQSLEIPILCANTPQAKGRVERANKTLQDRLVKEMRLRGINNMQQGNAYLPEFMADFNARFAVPPRSTLDAHRPLLAHQNLDQILVWQENRLVSKNLTLQFKNVVYQIQTDRPAYSLYKAQVTICQDAQGQVAILYKGDALAYTIFQKQEHQSEVVTAKQVAHPRKPFHPAPDHPWRRDFSV